MNTKNHEFMFRGFLHDVFCDIEKKQLLDPTLWRRFVQQFREDADYDAGWRGEYWGKMMRGGCYVYSYTKNSELYNILKTTVLDMLDSQDEDGRISSYGRNHEFDGWDIWGRKYVLLGMQYFYEICKEQELSEQILRSMCKQVDYIMTKIGQPEDGKLLITKATRHWRGLNSSSLLEPIVKLYKLTKEQKYLDFATYIVECGGTDVVNIFRLAYENQLYPYQYPVTKAYEMISCFSGLLEYYHVVGKEEHKTSIINFANKILESDFTIVGTGGCSYEFFDHSTVRQANTTNGNTMQETCVTVTLMKFFYDLMFLTEEAKYAEAFETSLYNAYLGSINTDASVGPAVIKRYPEWDIEPLPFDSYSPLTAGTRGNSIAGIKQMSDGHCYGCCACIGAMGIGLVPQMALVSTKQGLAMNLYINGSIHTQTVHGQPVTFRTETDYPINGSVRIHMDLANPEQFELRLRIPSWSKQTTLCVNGERYPIAEGYVCIAREWSFGDCIQLELDMRTEALRPIPYGEQVLMNRVIWGANYVIPTYDAEDPIAKNHLALRRGPIILAQENRLGYSVDEPVDIRVEEDGYVLVTPAEKEIAPYKHLIEMEVPLTDGSSMHVTDYASAGKLFTEESKMAAWMLIREVK